MMRKLFGEEEERAMKMPLRYIIPVIGIFSGLIFYVSALANVVGPMDAVKVTFSEPMSMLILGLGLIGFGSVIKKRAMRR